ncbi:hypothetical protein AVEN_102994-1 [Araneus ventricosus]|uniref:Uncharacterized protein n=1 Tax=Araneus ventricosus TaxID=182803 RepID=A0A4Y2B8D5_ARAVE|nr:hypothetical protein AVEN_102994-1 [Araneus ventricosus]
MPRRGGLTIVRQLTAGRRSITACTQQCECPYTDSPILDSISVFIVKLSPVNIPSSSLYVSIEQINGYVTSSGVIGSGGLGLKIMIAMSQ